MLSIGVRVRCSSYIKATCLPVFLRNASYTTRHHLKNRKFHDMAPRTKEELDALSVIDPELDAILKSGKMGPLPTFDYSNTAQAVRDMRAYMVRFDVIRDVPQVSYTQESYTSRDGHVNKLLIFRPSSVSQEQKLPLIAHIHGGGGCIGSPESTAPFCQSLVLSQNAVVVSIGYRLAPEHPFPFGVYDCADAIQYLAANAAKFGADPSLGFVLGGDSWGARATAILSLQAQSLDLAAPLTGLFFGAGGFIYGKAPQGYEDQLRSRFDERCLNSFVLGSQTWKMFSDAYAGLPDSPWSGALNIDDLTTVRGQPRAYFQVCGMDVLRDDSLIFEDILRSHGTPTKLDIYPGTPHVFWGMLPPGLIQQQVKRVGDTKQGFAWLLGKTETKATDAANL